MMKNLVTALTVLTFICLAATSASASEPSYKCSGKIGKGSAGSYAPRMEFKDVVLVASPVRDIFKDLSKFVPLDDQYGKLEADWKMTLLHFTGPYGDKKEVDILLLAIGQDTGDGDTYNTAAAPNSTVIGLDVSSSSLNAQITCEKI